MLQATLLRCQYRRLQNGRGERYLLRVLAGLRACVLEAYRVEDSEGIIAPRSMLNMRRQKATFSMTWQAAWRLMTNYS